MRIQIVFSSLLLCIICCSDDSGIFSPSNPSNLTPLCQFHGYCCNENDTAITTSRLLKIQNPAITLTWQSLGFTRFSNNYAMSSVETSIPFNFSGSFSDRPPLQVYTSNEAVLGILTLYSDVNNNGVFDRVVHPELQKSYKILDSLGSVFYGLRDLLYKVADDTRKRTECRDTFLIAYDNRVILVKNGMLDTLVQTPEWNSYILHRSQVLGKWNKWDYFFASRKRESPSYFEYGARSGYLSQIVFNYECSLFPRKGSEKEFNALLNEATKAVYNLNVASKDITKNAYINGHVDYPYNGVYEEGQDWAAGRTRWYHILYVPDHKSIREMLDAEKRSSFSIKNKQNIRPGYNLMYVDNQYRGEILSWDNAITIDLGTNEYYFNHPYDLVKPVTDFSVDKPLNEFVTNAEGVYEYRPYKHLILALKGGYLWASVPDIGVCRLNSADSLFYYNKPDNLQLEIVQDDGAIEKVLIYSGDTRFVGNPVGKDEKYYSFVSLLEKLESRKAVLKDSIEVKQYCKNYKSGSDTVKVYRENSSIGIQFPGFNKHTYYPLNDSVYFTDENDCEIAFKKGLSGDICEMHVIRNGPFTVYPAFDYIPVSSAVKNGSSYVSMNNVIDFHSGSGEDVLFKITGNRRYLASDDGMYLQKGDGCVYSILRNQSDDSVSLTMPHDCIVMKIVGLKDSVIGLELGLIAESSSDSTEVCFFTLCGSSVMTCSNPVVDNQFYSLKPDAPTVITVNPIQVNSDPFFIKIGVVKTIDITPRFAFDYYRIGL